MAEPTPGIKPPKVPPTIVGGRVHRPATVGGTKVAPQPVVIVPSEQRSVGPTRLGSPVAFLLVLGLILVYYALQGWDRKYGTFNGTFAGVKGNVQAVGTAVPPTPPMNRGTGTTS